MVIFRISGKTSEAMKYYDLSSGYTFILVTEKKVEEVVGSDDLILKGVAVDPIDDSKDSDHIDIVD